MRSLQISGGCWVALVLGVACGGSKTSPPADATLPPLGGAGGEGTGGTAITATGGSPAVGGATGTGGAGLPDGGAGNDGATGTGGAAGTGDVGPNDARVASDGTSRPEDALDAPEDLALRPDGQSDLRLGDTGVDLASAPPPPSRCSTLQLGTGRSTRDAIIVDVDGDRRPDIVTAEFNNQTAVFRQTAARTFADPDVYDLPSVRAYAVAAADLNQDGVLDFAFADGYGRVGLFMSGAGGVRATTVFTGPLSVVHEDIAIADFDRDGHLDVVVTVVDSATIGFLWANGPGTFLPRADQASGKSPRQLSVIDANEDGLPDLAVSCLGSPSRIHINNGDQTFTATTLYQTSGAEALATGDVNNDGHVDVVLPDMGYKRVIVLLGDGKGGFSQPTGLVTTTNSNPSRAALGDFNHDGNLDLVLGHRDDLQVFIYPGNGDGHFQSSQPKSIALTRAAASITAGDIDGDGYDDFIATNLDNGLTLVFGPCP